MRISGKSLGPGELATHRSLPAGRLSPLCSLSRAVITEIRTNSNAPARLVEFVGNVRAGSDEANPVSPGMAWMANIEHFAIPKEEPGQILEQELTIGPVRTDDGPKLIWPGSDELA